MFGLTFANIGELWDKLKPYFKAAWWATLVLLLSPQRLTDFLGLTDIRNHYRGYLGAFILLGGVQGILSYLKTRSEVNAEVELTRQFKEKVIDRIANLPREHRLVLAYCLFNDSRIIHGSTINPIIVSLCNQGILISPVGLVNAIDAPYTIRECAWEYLKANRASYIPTENHPQYGLFVESMYRVKSGRYLN